MAEVEEPEGGANEKSWPVPLRATAWGLLGALSLKDRLPDAAPAAVGVNVIATVHFPAAATGVEVEQVVPELEMANAPVTLISLKVRFALPVLVTVTVWGLLVVPSVWAEKVSDVGDKLTVAPEPVPLRITVCVLPATPLLLSVMVSVPAIGPVVSGIKPTGMTQLLPAARVKPPTMSCWQKVAVELGAAIAKSEGLTVMPVMVNAAVPVLLRVTFCKLLVVPVAWAPNDRVPGLTLATGTAVVMVYAAVATALVE